MDPQSWELTFVRIECADSAETAGLIRQRMGPVLDRPGHVVLDLRAAPVDSEGLGAVLALQRQLELHGRRLLVVDGDPELQALLFRTQVPGVLALFRDAGDAVNHVLGIHAARLAA